MFEWSVDTEENGRKKSWLAKKVVRARTVRVQRKKKRCSELLEIGITASKEKKRWGRSLRGLDRKTDQV